MKSYRLFFIFSLIIQQLICHTFKDQQISDNSFGKKAMREIKDYVKQKNEDNEGNDNDTNNENKTEETLKFYIFIIIIGGGVEFLFFILILIYSIYIKNKDQRLREEENSMLKKTIKDIE